VKKQTPQSSDLTSGKISNLFVNMAVPLAIGMVFSTLYNVVDTFYAGMISTDAQAGLAIASQVFFFLIALAFGLSAAMGALVGNALGGGDADKAHQFARQGLVFGLLASVLLTLLGYWFSPKIIALISEEGAYRTAANAYLQLLLLGIVSFLVAFGANGILQAGGDTRSMKRAQIVAFFTNLALNPLFIFGIPGWIPGIGFNGIALSTLVSQTGVMIYVLYRVNHVGIFRGVDLACLLPNLKTFREILAQALPSSFSMMVMMLAGLVIQYFLKHFGPEAVAGYGIALRIEQILLLPIFGLTGSLMPIAAQNYGAGNFDRVREAVFFSFKYGCLITIIAGILLWLFGGSAMSLFTNDAEVIRIGASYLRIDALILWAYLLLFSINALLQALKKPLWTLWIGVFRQGLGVAAFTYLYVIIFEMGTMGVWLGIATSVIAGLIISMIVAQIIAKKLIGGLFWQDISHTRKKP